MASHDLVDEDGYCRKTGLLPRECACAAHRGGEAVDTEEHPRGGKPNPVRYDDYIVEELYIAWTMHAKYGGGNCAVCGRNIVTGALIGLLKVIETDEEVTWCCEACVAKHQVRT